MQLDLELNYAQGDWVEGPGYLAAFELRRFWYFIRMEAGTNFVGDEGAFEDGCDIGSIINASRASVTVGGHWGLEL